MDELIDVVAEIIEYDRFIDAVCVLLVHYNFVQSKTECRKLIESGGIRINSYKLLRDSDSTGIMTELKKHKLWTIQLGKKKWINLDFAGV